MPRVKLTARGLEKLAAVNNHQTDYWDEDVTGLVIRVSPSGRKSFCTMYRVGRRFRRHTIGTYPSMGLAAARDIAKKDLFKVSQGEDPAQQKLTDRDAITFEQLAAEYLEKYAKPRKKSADEDERIIKVNLNPVIGKMRAKDIKRVQVRHVLDDIAVKAPIMANRTLAVVRKVFNWAIAQDYLEMNPCHLLAAPGEEKERDRVLCEDEIRAVWTAFDAEDSLVGSFFKLRLITAQRGAEVRSMQWSDVDFASAWWTIPAERSKNGLAHRVPLGVSAIRILETLQKEQAASKNEWRKSSPWVFPSPRPNQHIEDTHKAADRIRKSSKIENFRPHDLRRTAASLMTGMGISRLVVSKILNHVERGVTRVYDRHSYDNEKREALGAWARRLAVIVSGLHEATQVASR